ncbi:hypothetical protein CPB83DRAFT_847025 [Crepidotus variabilis]|uniref:Uncharacterized protein n=1 Tax=Crepidotus variabilis TaxID=179855 RepID=A0A9P6ENS2_9AGAR|nr:hypothetical protein CPB83DRAFT_847025 [Crepidotus variabilis]
MGDAGPTSRNLVVDTHHSIYRGQQPIVPPELIRLVLQYLEGDYTTLLQSSLSCKLLHAEAQPIIYSSLNNDDRPPPKLYIDKPSLAKFIRTIKFKEHTGVLEDEAMRKILSRSFAHHMPNLKSLTVDFEREPPKDFLSHGEFQLEELSFECGNYLKDFETTLRYQKQLKKLKSMEWDSRLPAFPLSVCPELHTLEADASVIKIFLPLHNVRILIWRSLHSEFSRPQVIDNLDYLAKGLRGLKCLRYPLAWNLPSLHNLTLHLSSLQYLAIEMHLMPTGHSSLREYSILTDLPQDLTAIPCLRGLVLSSSRLYEQSDITTDFMEGIFQGCPRLEFIDVESHRRKPKLPRARCFTRWIRGFVGESCTRQEGEVYYRRLSDCFQSST